MGKILRIGLHGTVLAIGCLASILVGFGFYHMLGVAWQVDQLIIQAPTAIVVLMVGFSTWYMLINRTTQSRFLLKGWGEITTAYVFSLVITPLIFLPLHYMTQGYVSSIENLLSVLYFQIPTNLITLLTAVYMVRPLTWSIT